MRVLRREYASPVGVILMVLNFFFGLILILIGLRILLLLLGANNAAGFVNFIYNGSEPFVVPFRGIFPNEYLGSGFFFDAAATLAFVVYSLVLWLINSVFGRYGEDRTIVDRDI